MVRWAKAGVMNPLQFSQAASVTINGVDVSAEAEQFSQGECKRTGTSSEVRV